MYDDNDFLFASIVDYNVPDDELPIIITSGYFTGERLNKYIRAGYAII